MNKKHTPKKCKGLKRPPMKEEAPLKMQLGLPSIAPKIKQNRQVTEGTSSANQMVKMQGDAFCFDRYRAKKFSTTSAVQREPHHLKRQPPHSSNQPASDVTVQLRYYHIALPYDIT
jgi:hypothetical protein